jgi:hypothetical protein
MRCLRIIIIFNCIDFLVYGAKAQWRRAQGSGLRGAMVKRQKIKVKRQKGKDKRRCRIGTA